MLDVKILFRIQALLLCAGVFVSTAYGMGGRSGGVTKTNIPPFVTQVQRETLPGLPPYMRVVASVGTNKFAFLAPRGFRVDASDTKKITLISTNETTFITVRLLPPLPKQGGKLKKKSLREVCRELLLAGHAGGKILSEFTRNAGNFTGPAFDIEWPVPHGALEMARVAFIQSPVGVLVFKMTTSPGRFHSAIYKFNNVLLSFRASKNGKLEVVRLSDKF